MSVIKKTTIILVSIVVVSSIAITIMGYIVGGGLFFMAPSHNKMDRFLVTNLAELSYVANTLLELEYDSIEIQKDPLREEDKYNMKVSPKYLVYETVPIPDELVDHIQDLYESGVRAISCGRDIVSFSVWAFMDEIRGIKYTRTGEKPDGEQLIDVRQLSKENWYYYVHNYEKAKARNPHLFQ